MICNCSYNYNLWMDSSLESAILRTTICRINRTTQCDANFKVIR